ncbi:MAG: HEPN domain-containing protein [bacterium]
MFLGPTSSSEGCQIFSLRPRRETGPGPFRGGTDCNGGHTHNKEFSSLHEYGAFLDRFYIPTRYPNGLPGGIPALAFREKDAMEAIELAEKVIEFAASKLPAL